MLRSSLVHVEQLAHAFTRCSSAWAVRSVPRSAGGATTAAGECRRWSLPLESSSCAWIVWPLAVPRWLLHDNRRGPARGYLTYLGSFCRLAGAPTCGSVGWRVCPPEADRGSRRTAPGRPRGLGWAGAVVATERRHSFSFYPVLKTLCIRGGIQCFVPDPRYGLGSATPPVVPPLRRQARYPISGMDRLVMSRSRRSRRRRTTCQSPATAQVDCGHCHVHQSPWAPMPPRS